MDGQAERARPLEIDERALVVAELELAQALERPAGGVVAVGRDEAAESGLRLFVAVEVSR